MGWLVEIIVRWKHQQINILHFLIQHSTNSIKQKKYMTKILKFDEDINQYRTQMRYKNE